MLNLITFNSWWDTEKVPPLLLKPYKRGLFSKLVEFLGDRQILLIYGLRRVGKTTLLYQLIDHLLEQGVERDHILYFSFDEAVADLKQIIEGYQETAIGKPLQKVKKVYIFLDEIQKLKNWQNQIKIYYDLYPNI